MPRLLPYLICAACLLVAPAFGDALVTASEQATGSFRGFEKGEFLFRMDAGKAVAIDRVKVKSLELTKPRRIRLLEKGKRESSPAVLLGYTSPNFLLRAKSGERKVLGMRVEQIEVLADLDGPRHAGNGGPAEAPPPDVAALEARADLTADQSAALKRYKEARAEYDRFVAQNSTLVAAFDSSTGAKRMELAERLRARKIEEQPIRAGLAQAESALRALLPAPVEAGARAGGVWLLDVAPLKAGALSAPQRDALSAYERAKELYLARAGSPDATAALRKAEATLLSAFPDVTIQR